MVLLLAAGAWGQSMVFVMRHADRYGTEPDPSITPEGQRQAEALARLLAEARITRIFVSEALRTSQTAAPAAARFHVTPVTIDARKQDELIRQVREGLRDGEATLVVGHRGSVPKIVKELSGKDVAPLAVGEYDRLVMVTIFAGGAASVVTLRFGH